MKRTCVTLLVVLALIISAGIVMSIVSIPRARAQSSCAHNSKPPCCPAHLPNDWRDPYTRCLTPGDSVEWNIAAYMCREQTGLFSNAWAIGDQLWPTRQACMDADLIQTGTNATAIHYHLLNAYQSGRWQMPKLWNQIQQLAGWLRVTMASMWWVYYGIGAATTCTALAAGAVAVTHNPQSGVVTDIACAQVVAAFALQAGIE